MYSNFHGGVRNYFFLSHCQAHNTKEVCLRLRRSQSFKLKSESGEKSTAQLQTNSTTTSACSLWNEQADSRDSIFPEPQLMVKSYFKCLFLAWESSVWIAEDTTSSAHQKSLCSNCKCRGQSFERWKTLYRVLKRLLIHFLRYTSIFLTNIHLNTFPSL